MTERVSLRSLLFVPVLRERYFDSAIRGAPDAVILDLEDAIPPALKIEARARLGDAVKFFRSHELPTLVRVNRDSVADLQACAAALPGGVILPKTGAASELDKVAEVLGEVRERLQILPTIESAAGLIEAAAIARHHLTSALCFGAGDFALDCRMDCREDLLFPAALQVVVAASAAGRRAYGLPGPIHDVENPERFAVLCRRARTMGFAGTPVIHPSQIEAAELGFSPTEEEVARATAVVHRFEASDGLPLMNAGELIEWPIYTAAREVIAAAAARNSKKTHRT